MQTFDAAKAIVGPERGQKVDEAAEEIEKDLTLVGCTGVEDKLQDGVPETIDKLAKVRPTHRGSGGKRKDGPAGLSSRHRPKTSGQKTGRISWRRANLSKGAAF